jgi:hypothetical protein
VNGRAFSYNEGEISDRGLSDFLQGEKPPTLGTIAYLLRQPKPNASKLRLALHTYLAGLPNGAFLTSKAFAHKGLQRV